MEVLLDDMVLFVYKKKKEKKKAAPNLLCSFLMKWILDIFRISGVKPILMQARSEGGSEDGRMNEARGFFGRVFRVSEM